MLAMAAPTTDEELAAQALGPGADRREALGELLERHAAHLFNFFRLEFRDDALAEDLVQEVFTRVIRARERFQTGRPFRPWLWTIAHNLARTERRRARPATQSLETADDPDGRPLSERLEDDSPSAYRQMVDRERSEQLEMALAQLTDQHREVLMLKYFQELPCREVAQILGVTEGTVWSRTHRALMRVGEILGPEMRSDGGDLA